MCACRSFLLCLPPKLLVTVVPCFLFSPQPSLADFHNAFQVVFVDPSGHLNMCADMTACTYKQVDTLKYICVFKQNALFYWWDYLNRI